MRAWPIRRRQPRRAMILPPIEDVDEHAFDQAVEAAWDSRAPGLPLRSPHPPSVRADSFLRARATPPLAPVRRSSLVRRALPRGGSSDLGMPRNR